MLATSLGVDLLSVRRTGGMGQKELFGPFGRLLRRLRRAWTGRGWNGAGGGGGEGEDVKDPRHRTALA